MGGAISASSEPGQGSTFTFAVPLPPTTEGAVRCHIQAHKGRVPAPAPPQAKGVAETVGLRVLLVEDHPVNQKLAARILEKLGYRVDVAANGREAVAAVSRHAYAAILMDCQMPELDGFAATRLIRQSYATRPEQPRLPIIAMTANAMPGDRERCLEAGMDDYIAKPISLEVLKATLERWLDRSLAARAAA